MKTEYKVLAVFLLLGLGIVIFFGLKNGEIESLINSVVEKKFIDCTKTSRNQGVNYTDHTCIVKDDTGRTVQISVPQIDKDTQSYKSVNETLRRQLSLAKDNITYDKVDGKYQISSITPIKYKIMNTTDILSIVVIQGLEQGVGVKSSDTYQTYNFDLKTGKKISSQEVLKSKNLSSDFSSKLTRELIMIFANELGYSYYDVPENSRNSIIDTTINQTSYKNLDKVYIDQQGRVSFILELYNKEQYHTNSYFFKVSSAGKITYTKEFEE